VTRPLSLVPLLLEPFPVLSPPVSTAGAAVTIVLRDGATEPEVLLIERAPNPSDPASGQVALPGGRVEDRDGSLASTALRELEEEVGLSRTDLAGPLRFVGTDQARSSGLRVGVFAGELAPHGRSPGVRSSREVAHVFWLPRSQLNHVRRVTEETVRGPAEVLATVYEGHVLWGFTRRIVRDFFGLPSDALPNGALFSSPREDLRPLSAPPGPNQDGPSEAG